MKKYFTQMILVIGFFMAIGFYNSAIAADKQIKLKFNHQWAPTSNMHLFYESWAESIESKTNGRVKIEIYPGSALLHPREDWLGLKMGAADINSGWFHYNKSGFKFYKEQLYFWTGFDSIKYALEVQNKMFEKYPALAKGMNDNKILWQSGHTVRWYFGRGEKIASISDFKGRSIRAPMPAEADLVKQMGAVAPSFLSMGQVYTALQKGVIDGLWGPEQILSDFRLAEVVDHAVDAKLQIGTGNYIAMNKRKWDSLPRDIQEIFKNETPKAFMDNIKVWEDATITARKFASDQGVKYIHLTPEEQKIFQGKMRAVQDRVAKKLDEKGLPGSALLKDIREAVQNQPE